MKRGMRRGRSKGFIHKSKAPKNQEDLIALKSKIHTDPSRAITLKTKLDQIYSSKANFNTTCEGKCECCKVAMPQMNYSEFCQLINEVWDTSSKTVKIDLICASIDYFFRNQFEKWGMDSLIKPCLLLSSEGKCRYYKSRPLNCRIYGLWPAKSYEERVDKFEKAYEGLLTREQLPLNTQCPYVKRVDPSIPITADLIESVFNQLDELDKKVGNFTELQIKNRENYRTFHDWLLLKTFGEDWLVKLTDFIMAADKDSMVDLVTQIIKATRSQFAKEMPDPRGK